MSIPIIKTKAQVKLSELLNRGTFKDSKFDINTIDLVKIDIEHFLEEINYLEIEGFTAAIILKHIDTYTELVYMYLSDKRVFSIAYSGGKDSTVTVDVVLKSLLLIKYMYGKESLTKTSYVLFSDTLMEMDSIIEGILNSIKKIDEYSKQHELNIHVKRVSPNTKNSYFSLFIGKGYLAPTKQSLWCSSRLKIEPQKRAIVEILNDNKQGFIAITGQRQEESPDRKKRMVRQTILGSFKEHEFTNCNLYAPIEHWKVDEVWNHIDNHKLSWVDSLALGRVYAEASSDGDECRTLLEGMETGSKSMCGMSARFGCWSCLIFEKDKTLGNLTNHYPYMTELEKLRNWFAQFRNEKWDSNRDTFIHGKHRMKKYDFDNHRNGMFIPGGYTLYLRIRMLSELLKTERKVIKERGKPLVTDDELAYIHQCWVEDGNLDYSVKEIAYDRDFMHLVEPSYPKAIKSVEFMKNYEKPNNLALKKFSWKWIYTPDGNIAFDPSRFNERYFCQMALQLEKRYFDSYLIMSNLFSSNMAKRQESIDLIKSLPLERMDFIDTARENYIRQEWKNDKIGFLTFLERYDNKEIKKPTQNLFGYEGDYGSHFEQLDEFNSKGDIIECESISLQDKMRWFEKW